MALSHYMKGARAFLARGMFALHSLLAIYRAYVVYDDPTFFCFLVMVVAIFVEGGVNISTRSGNETRWFCASIFLFLCATVPPLWFLELDLSSFEYRKSRGLLEEQVTRTPEGFQQIIDIKVDVGPEMWVQFLEQILLVVLILGRWILPKGEITREQLSNLLLIYLAVSADTIELFEVFKEPMVRQSRFLTVLILIIWTMSLFQFCLVITQPNKGRKAGFMNPPDRLRSTASLPGNLLNSRIEMPPLEKQRPTWVIVIKSIEVWAIIISMCLQDAPFLVMRLYLTITFRIMSYSMVFFICKNTLICLLQIYRLIVVVSDIRSKNRAAHLMKITAEALSVHGTRNSFDEIHFHEPPTFGILEEDETEAVTETNLGQLNITIDDADATGFQMDNNIGERNIAVDRNDNPIRFDSIVPPSARGDAVKSPGFADTSESESLSLRPQNLTVTTLDTAPKASPEDVL